MFLLIDELVHFSIALLIGLFFYWRHRRWELILAALIPGFLIDVDHLIDYFLWHGFTFDLRLFFDVDSYMETSGKVYVLFHGWELIPVFWLLGQWLGKRSKIKDLSWAVSLAYFGHLFWDYLAFYRYPLNYSLIFRIINRFEAEKFFNLGF